MRAVALTTLVLGLTSACSKDAADSPDSSGASATDQRVDSSGSIERVILITCDTLRADRLQPYGCDRETSPALDAFAREAVVYDRALSASSFTYPSITSLLTGRTPDEIGTSSGNRSRITESVTTFPELLSESGIQTAAVVSNWVLRRMVADDPGDIDQGFDHYDDEMSLRELNRDGYERLGADTTAAAIEWLEQAANPDHPFFLWVHYQDPHGPYTPPDRWREAFERTPDETSKIELPFGSSHKGLRQIPNYQVLGDEHRPEVYRDLYDAEIRSFDESLEVLLDWLKANNLWEGSLVLFTSDHGESLGEHNYWFCHGETLQPELVRVPLIVRYPGAYAPAGSRDVGGYRRSDELVGHIDLWATVLDAFDLEQPPSRGRSLLGAPLGDRVIVQTLYRAGSAARTEAIADSQWRLITTRKGARLFEHSDRDEVTDLASERPDIVEGLTRRLEAYLAALSEPLSAPSQEPQLDREALEALEALGYVESRELDQH